MQWPWFLPRECLFRLLQALHLIGMVMYMYQLHVTQKIPAILFQVPAAVLHGFIIQMLDYLSVKDRIAHLLAPVIGRLIVPFQVVPQVEQPLHIMVML